MELRLDPHEPSCLEEDLEFAAAVYALRTTGPDPVTFEREGATQGRDGELRAVGRLAERLVPLACDGWTNLSPLVATGEQPLRCWSLRYRNGSGVLALREDGRIVWWDDRASEYMDRAARCAIVFLVDFPASFLAVDILLQSPLPIWLARAVALLCVLGLLLGTVVGLDRIRVRLPRPRMLDWSPEDPDMPLELVQERLASEAQYAVRRIKNVRSENGFTGPPPSSEVLQELHSLFRL